MERQIGSLFLDCLAEYQRSSLQFAVLCEVVSALYVRYTAYQRSFCLETRSLTLEAAVVINQSMDMSSQAFESTVEGFKQTEHHFQVELDDATDARQTQSNRADKALEQVCSACQGSLVSVSHASWVQQAFEPFDATTQKV